jgi:hypothetical protein
MFKKSILKELEQQLGSSDVDLRGPTREYLSCFIKLHGQLRELIAIFKEISHAPGMFREYSRKELGFIRRACGTERTIKSNGDHGWLGNSSIMCCEMLKCPLRAGVHLHLRKPFASSRVLESMLSYARYEKSLLRFRL